MYQRTAFKIDWASNTSQTNQTIFQIFQVRTKGRESALPWKVIRLVALSNHVLHRTCRCVVSCAKGGQHADRSRVNSLCFLVLGITSPVLLTLHYMTQYSSRKFPLFQVSSRISINTIFLRLKQSTPEQMQHCGWELELHTETQNIKN